MRHGQTLCQNARLHHQNDREQSSFQQGCRRGENVPTQMASFHGPGSWQPVGETEHLQRLYSPRTGPEPRGNSGEVRLSVHAIDVGRKSR